MNSREQVSRSRGRNPRPGAGSSSPLPPPPPVTRIKYASEKPAPSAAAMKAPKEESLPKNHPVPKASSSPTQNMAKPGFPFTATSSAATPSSAKGTGFYSKPLYDPPEPEVRPELDLSKPKSLLELQPFLPKEAEEWCGFYHTPVMDYKCQHAPRIA